MKTFYLFKDLSRILRLLDSRLKLRSFFTGVLLLLESLTELGFLLTIASMTYVFSNSQILRDSFFYSTLFELSPELGVWSQNSHNFLFLTGLVLIIVSIIKNIISYATAKSIALLGEDISIFLSLEIMRNFLYRDYAWHLSSESDGMFTSLMWRGNIGMMLTHLLSIYAYAFTIIILFISLIGQETALTTMVLVVTIVIGFILYRSLRRNIDINAKRVVTSNNQESRVLLCSIRGIREVLIYGQQKTFLEELKKTELQGRQARVYNNIVATIPTWVLESVGFIIVVCSLAYLMYYVKADTPRIAAALGLLLLTVWRVLPFCNRIISLNVSVRSLRPFTNGVLDLLEKLRKDKNCEPVVPDPDFRFRNNISLSDVCFRYPSADVDSLKHISLSIEKGQKVGLIGLSGAGKSTLAGVLSGLLPVSSGSILVDRAPLTPEGSAALARRTGYVPQNPFLFAGTLAENIVLSQWGKPWDTEEVLHACDLAAIDFIEHHPAGLDRPIGENGEGLSGGQAQRVAIARALYAQPQLLIFDEATSSLDQTNENIIQQTIDRLPDQVTCIIIAHRLSTVRNCDKIVWLQNGRIHMTGPAQKVLQAYEEANSLVTKKDEPSKKK